jgi:hypothetical protein
MFFTGEEDDDVRRRISQISTHWSALHSPSVEVTRYAGPVFRYFLGIVRQVPQAEDLAMQFVQRFLTQDVQRHARPESGRFRDYLKASLRNMAQDVWRQAAKDKKLYAPLPGDGAHLPESESTDTPDIDEFDTQCHIERIDAAWERLRKEEEESSGKGGDGGARAPYYTVLRLQSERAEMSAQEIADELNRSRPSTLKPENVRQLLSRARRKFGEYLLDEVLKSLPVAEHGELETELIELRLLPYCKAAFRERQELLRGRSAESRD